VEGNLEERPNRSNKSSWHSRSKKKVLTVPFSAKKRGRNPGANPETDRQAKLAFDE
jgi:hypothetical protein